MGCEVGLRVLVLGLGLRSISMTMAMVTSRVKLLLAIARYMLTSPSARGPAVDPRNAIGAANSQVPPRWTCGGVHHDNDPVGRPPLLLPLGRGLRGRSLTGPCTQARRVGRGRLPLLSRRRLFWFGGRRVWGGRGSTCATGAMSPRRHSETGAKEENGSVGLHNNKTRQDTNSSPILPKFVLPFLPSRRPQTPSRSGG